MGRVIRTVVSIGASLVGAAIGFAIGGPIGATIGAALFSAGARALMGTPGGPRRAAAAATLQIGEQPRQAIFGRSAVSGSLVDAFNYGGKYGTDWEVLVIALADHRCDALEGFFVDDRYIAFTGDGNVAGFNNQLQVFWRSGTWGQTVPTILTSNGAGWTANDRGRGVAYVVVAYKADDEKAKNPVWPSGRPRFRWVVRGLRCYQARKDSTVGGSGAHRWNDPATWQWTENPIDIAHNWRRGIYAGDLVDQPGMLLIGRGLSAIEAPPANVFARANLCDELVGGQPRYRIGGVAASTEPFIDVEGDFAAACAGVISQPEGAVEVDPGEAKAAVAHFTDGDLIVGSKVRWNKGILGQQDASWLNTVVARYVEPAQRWAQHSAPVLRDLADITADRAPREQQLALDFVTNGAQAQRVGEIFRRFGRLWGRATVTLPPRFAFIEEGDWVTWQSDRRFGGATLTFRVEAWGSDAAWHHTLTLRQISASVYSDTAPLDDGSIASDQDPPPVVGAPDPASWTAAIVTLDGGGVEVPALRIAGVVEDPAARFVVFEYVEQTAAPGPSTVWSFVGSSPPDVTRADIPIPAGGTFWAAVSYVVDGVLGDRLVLGPLGAGGADFVGRLPGSRVDGDFGGNFIADPIFGDDWVYSNAGYSPGGSGANLYDRHRAVFFGEGVIWFVGSGFPALERAAVQVGETYYFSGWFFRSASATGNVAARVELFDAAGVNVGVVDIPGVTTIGMATDTWRRLQGQWTCPAGVSYVRPLVGNNTGGTSGTIFVGLPYFGRHQPGADVTADAQITFTAPPPFQIQADSAGITTTDLSTQTRSITLLRGGVAQASGVTVGTPTGNPSASISVASATVSGGIVTVTLATANASGSVTIPVVFEGVSYPVTIAVNRTIAAPAAGGSGSELFTDGSWANINTTTYTQVTDSGATVRSTSGGQLSFGFSAQYNGGNVQCKAQYSPDGATWSDVAGTETTGTGAITVPGEEEPGSISRAPVTQSSLAASTPYFVRLVARRTGGTGTISWIAPSFTARQP